MNRKLFLITFLITLVMLVGVMVISIYSYYQFQKESSTLIRKNESLTELLELSEDLRQYQYFLALGDTLDPNLIIPSTHLQTLDSLRTEGSISSAAIDSLTTEIQGLSPSNPAAMQQSLVLSDQILDRLISKSKRSIRLSRNDRDSSGELTPGTLVFLYLITLGIIIYIFLHTLSLLKKVDQLNRTLAQKNQELNEDYEELNSLQEVLSSVLNSSLNGIIYFEAIRDDSDTIIDLQPMVLNQTAADIIKLPMEDILEKTLLEFHPGNKEAGIFDIYANVIESGVSNRFIQKYELDGLDGWFDISSVKSEDGVVVTFSDISESVRRQEQLETQQAELERNREKYRSLFERSTDAVFTLTSTLEFTEVSPSTVEIFNVSRKKLIGSDLTKLYVELPDKEDLLRELGKNRTYRQNEIEFHKGSNDSFLGDISLRAIEDQKGIITGFQGIVRDITLQKKAADEIQLAERLALTGRIARSIAHEVRNPLTNLKLALGQLEDEISSTEDTDMLTEIIERNATRIDSLINELLTSSRGDTLDRKPHDIREIIEDSIQLIRDRILLKGMKVSSEYPDEIPMVCIEPESIRRALLNLMVNAVEAMEEDKGVLTIKVTNNSKCVYIGIKDNGEGIEKDEIKHLFDPFYTNKKSGMGLGLTSVHTIIKSHEGKVEVNSTVGSGTEFVLALPIVI